MTVRWERIALQGLADAWLAAGSQERRHIVAAAAELSAVEPRLRSNVHAPNGHLPKGRLPCGHALCGLLPHDEAPEDLPGGESDVPEQPEPLAPWGLSQRQLAFIQDLAGQIQGLGVRRLPALVALQYDKNLTELSSVEASRLISLLRQVRSGSVSLQALLEDGQSEH